MAAFRSFHPEIFENVYWATLKPIIQDLWSEGLQTLFYAEGSWDHHLESFAELPDRSIVYHLDQGDIYKTRDVLGDKFCLSGGVPNTLLSWATPEDVRKRCLELIEGYWARRRLHHGRQRDRPERRHRREHPCNDRNDAGTRRLFARSQCSRLDRGRPTAVARTCKAEYVPGTSIGRQTAAGRVLCVA